MDQSIKAASGFEEIDTGVVYFSFVAIIEDALVTATPGKQKQRCVKKAHLALGGIKNVFKLKTLTKQKN